jgi:hypothetical protein
MHVRARHLCLTIYLVTLEDFANMPVTEGACFVYIVDVFMDIGFTNVFRARQGISISVHKCQG